MYGKQIVFHVFQLSLKVVYLLLSVMVVSFRYKLNFLSEHYLAILTKIHLT